MAAGYDHDYQEYEGVGGHFRYHACSRCGAQQVMVGPDHRCPVPPPAGTTFDDMLSRALRRSPLDAIDERFRGRRED